MIESAGWYRGKFEAALVEGYLSWASMVRALVRLDGGGSWAIDGGAAIAQMYRGLRVCEGLT